MKSHRNIKIRPVAMLLFTTASLTLSGCGTSYQPVEKTMRTIVEKEAPDTHLSAIVETGLPELSIVENGTVKTKANLVEEMDKLEKYMDISTKLEALKIAKQATNIKQLSKEEQPCLEDLSVNDIYMMIDSAEEKNSFKANLESNRSIQKLVYIEPQVNEWIEDNGLAISTVSLKTVMTSFATQSADLEPSEYQNFSIEMEQNEEQKELDVKMIYHDPVSGLEVPMKVATDDNLLYATAQTLYKLENCEEEDHTLCKESMTMAKLCVQAGASLDGYTVSSVLSYKQLAKK